MASPMDVQCCYDAILSASQCHEMGLMDTKEFEEMRLVLLNVARKYASVCMQGRLRADDIE